MKLSKLRWVVPVIVSMFISGPAFAAAGLPTAAPAARTAPAAPAAPAPGTPSTAVAAATALAGQMQGYAEREQQASGLSKFKGGVGIYIGGSALVIVLVVILLLVLL